MHNDCTVERNKDAWNNTGCDISVWIATELAKVFAHFAIEISSGSQLILAVLAKCLFIFLLLFIYVNIIFFSK